MSYLLWQVVSEGASRHPTRAAVSWRDLVLSYAELDEASTRLAHSLAQAGIGPGARVGLYLPKSHKAVISMIAALKAGAAYVPIDPHAPASRAAYILRDCAVRVLVTTPELAAQLEPEIPALDALQTIYLTECSQTLSSPDSVSVRQWSELAAFPATPVESRTIESDPAYLLYTSGSTGRPKGVVLTHRNALTFVDWAVAAFRLEPDDRMSSHAPLHSDLSIFDVFGALRAGACVALVPEDISPFPGTLAEWIHRERITVWYSVPSALIRLSVHGRLERWTFDTLRAVLFAGEVFALKHLRQLMDQLPHAELYNLYGPTETNVCTYHRVTRPLGDISSLSIGRACENTEVFALDERGAPIEAGQEGELFVRGPTVMAGYWGDQSKTEMALGRNPLQPAYSELAYRTGDIVRLEQDGTYTFLGRRDHMVKSRGYRIELGEVEHVLHAHDAVREAVVVATPDDEIGARLSAVVAAHEATTVSARALQAFCATRLPRHMVPETIVFRDALPLTSTGKADRIALTAMFANSLEHVGS